MAIIYMPIELPTSETRQKLHPLQQLLLEFNYHVVACIHINPLISDLRKTKFFSAHCQLKQLPTSISSPHKLFMSLQKLLIETNINHHLVH